MTTEHVNVDHAARQNGPTLIDRRKRCIWIRIDAELTAITLTGEIGASDIHDLSPHARRLVRNCDVLTVDLSGSEFIPVDGLSALLALWSAGPAAPERQRVREARIRSECLTVVLRHVG
jgi:hypothetical protein